MSTSKYLNGNGLSEAWTNTKNYIAAQLLSKSDVGHTHTKSEITDFPAIPTKTSDLTNDSGFLTSADRLPIGSYIQFAGSQAPEGFLVCNGGEISRTTYSQLFDVIGTTYGSGDGSTTFNLPNLTDRFLQGSTTSGTVKDAGLPNIAGGAKFDMAGGSNANVWDCRGSFTTNDSGINFATSSDYVRKTSSLSNGFNFNASRSSSIYGNSSTVQPPALTCLICIKY